MRALRAAADRLHARRCSDAQHALKAFLRDELYSHPRVRQMTQQAQETVRWLFETLSADYALMPEEHAERARAAAERGDAAGARASSPTTSRA